MTTHSTHYASEWLGASAGISPASDAAAGRGARSSLRCTVVELHAHAMAPPESPEFDAFLAELENTPVTAAALADGRRWVGQQFYADAPTLTSLRLAAGLSQRQLAERCGIEQPHVSRYESGRHEPRLSVASDMAAALGVSLDAFSSACKNTGTLARNTVSTGNAAP